MPGTPEEYMSDPETSKAIELMDQAISEQKSGADIIQMLEGSGLRIYTPEDMGAPEEDPMAEDPMAMEEEMPMEEEPPMDGGMPMSDEGMGMEPQTGSDGGMRDMRIDAVRFALDKDKKNKDQAEKELA